MNQMKLLPARDGIEDEDEELTGVPWLGNPWGTWLLKGWSMTNVRSPAVWRSAGKWIPK
jgi:hypothetical protein